MKFEVYADAADKYRWRLRSNNGQLVASSGEAFASKSNADRAANGFKAGAASYTYNVTNTGDQWYWSAVAGNGEKVATGGEGFASKSNAERAAENVRDNAGKAEGP